MYGKIYKIFISMNKRGGGVGELVIKLPPNENFKTYEKTLQKPDTKDPSVISNYNSIIHSFSPVSRYKITNKPLMSSLRDYRRTLE